MQREEELAKEQARAEQLKQEREMLAQKEEAERQARKKVTIRHVSPLRKRSYNEKNGWLVETEILFFPFIV